MAGHGHEPRPQIVQFALLRQRHADAFFGLLALVDVQRRPNCAIQQVVVVDSLPRQRHPDGVAVEFAHLQLALKPLAPPDGLGHCAAHLQVLLPVQIDLFHGVKVVLPQSAKQAEHGRVGPAEATIWREEGNAHY